MDQPMNLTARSAKQLGLALQQRRSAKGLTQTELANLVGTGQKTISKIENGNPATRMDTLFSILAALDLELDIQLRGRGVDDLAEILGLHGAP